MDGLRVAIDLRRGAFHLRVDLALPGRGVIALFGPSGAGKSTLLRVLAGLERGRGVVRIGDEAWQDDDRGLFVPTHRRGIGVVFQEASLFPHLSVKGNLAYGQKRAGTRARAVNAGEVTALLGIESILDRSPRDLSGGERQRVAIARAVLAGPRLLLMDEPLASLDGARKAEILPYLERLRDGASIPIVYVSHAIEEVARLATHLVALGEGSVVASGPLKETLARLDLPLALTDDAGVVLETTVVEHDDHDHLTRLDYGGGSLWAGRVDRPAGARARVRILAKDVSLALAPPGPTSILNVLPARVVDCRDDGPDRVVVRLAVGAGEVALLARITRRSRDALGIAAGVEVVALVKSVALVA